MEPGMYVVAHEIRSSFRDNASVSSLTRVGICSDVVTTTVGISFLSNSTLSYFLSSTVQVDWTLQHTINPCPLQGIMRGEAKYTGRRPVVPTPVLQPTNVKSVKK
jgi:hypothetical protein